MSVKETAISEHGNIHFLNGLESVRRGAAASKDKVEVLKKLVIALLMEVQALGEVAPPDITRGIDFYDEVRRFEVDLIQRALRETGGHQVRAARLLGMKVTTLNSKIKHYNIRWNVLAGGETALDTAEEAAS